MFAIAALIALAVIVTARFGRRSVGEPVATVTEPAVEPAPAAVIPPKPSRPADHFRKGENAPQRHGRAARVRVGHHMSVARRWAVVGALVARLNGGRATAAGYLADVLGADREFVRRFSSPFGKAASKAYRARTGVEPVRDCVAWVGRRLVAVFSYEACDLAEAARAYPRTAELLTLAA